MDSGSNNRRRSFQQGARYVLGSWFVATLLLAGCAIQNPDTPDWKPLFNGRDLDDWTVKIAGYEPGDNFGNTYRVGNGVIHVSYDAYDRFESQFGVMVYNQPFSYYRLRVEYRFLGEQVEGGPSWAYRNSGLMIHSQSPESMLKDQDFPISIEVQLLGGSGEGERTTANLCTPGTNVVMSDSLITAHCVNSVSQTYNGDGWVSVEVEVLGDSLITHYVNGGQVLSYERPQMGGGNVNGHNEELLVPGKLLQGGYIGLQSESHTIEFRKVDLLNLAGCMDPKARNYKSYLVESIPSECLF